MTVSAGSDLSEMDISETAGWAIRSKSGIKHVTQIKFFLDTGMLHS
jgi:hypothetical protein